MSPGKVIRSPPTYHAKPERANGAASTAEKKDGRASTRGRRSASVRSEDPAEVAKTPGRPKATPRKPRKGRGASSKLDAGEGRGSAEPEDDAAAGVNGAVAGRLETVPETVKVEVETIEKPDEEEAATTTTSVSVTMPAGHSGLPLPEDPQEMLAEARRMVEEAREIDGPSRSKGKRKLEDFAAEEEEVETGPPLPAKRARKLEVELRKERIKRRALVGIAGSLAIGYVSLPAVAHEEPPPLLPG